MNGMSNLSLSLRAESDAEVLESGIVESKAKSEISEIVKNVFERRLLNASVFANKEIISQHYIPEKLPFREKQIDEISSDLSPSIKGTKPNNIFLYGKTGTGKTATVKHVLEQLTEFVSKQSLPVFSAYINCRNHPSKYKVLLKVAKSFYPSKDFLGYSVSFIYEKILDFCEANSAHLILVLDEIDKVKDLDELVYSLTRGNDELGKGSITLIGISNNLMFKEKLDPRTKSSLCEKELVFSPYNANELKEILVERCEKAFKPKAVSDSSISLVAALAAQESGDARTAVMLMQRAGEIADSEKAVLVVEQHVEKAKASVEEEIILSMVSTLPGQQQLVLYSISAMTIQHKGSRRITGEIEEGTLFSGEIFETYCEMAKHLGRRTITSRWYRQYINELEMYGLILITASGKGIRGQTRLIKLGFDAERIKSALEKELFK
ncbi:MAG: AAA family ATPase [Candidatus Diapherotrites archaeon]|nr:AAA family ATPase [Candidatus Diapherotrites archaeon]